jgi:sodium/potassium/calcium exchanger 6
MTGVTFLALGNGAPDLFSTFNAMQQSSYGLAIGELFGAATFITTVVVGVVALLFGFRVTRRPFLRDVLFFLFAVLFMMFVLWDGVITIWESIFLVLYYILYVASVGLGR